MNHSVVEDMSRLVSNSATLAAEFASRSHCGHVYLGGAPLAGLGTPRSDVDVFAFATDSHNSEVEQDIIDGNRLDIEYVTKGTLLELYRIVDEFEIEQMDMTALTAASRSALDRTVRFVLGEIVLDGDGFLASLMSKFSSISEKLGKVLVARHALDVANLFEDVEGAELVGDEFCSGYQSRESVFRAAEAYLASQGDFYVGTKWLRAKWNRTVGDALGAWVPVFLFGETYSASRTDALSAQWLAQDLLVMAISGVQYRPIQGPGVPGTARRVLGVSPMAMADGNVLIVRRVDEGVELSVPGLALWGIAHGRSREDAVAMVHRTLIEAGWSPSISDVDAYYGSLVGLGLLSDGMSEVDRCRPIQAASSGSTSLGHEIDGA